MTVQDLLELLIDVTRFRLVSLQNESDILYEELVDSADIDEFVLSMPVRFYGIADKDTIEFYVDENDFY